MKVVVFGAGYVGLVQAAGLAAIGHDVVLVDVDAKKLAVLEAGKAPFYEPELEELLAEARGPKKLVFRNSSLNLDPTDVLEADFIFVAVGTPPMPDGSADTRQIMAVAGTIRQIFDHGAIFGGRFGGRCPVVAIKSTVPPGTAALVRASLPPGSEVLSNPEFLREGQAVYDFFHPDRVVIGCGEDTAPARKLVELYKFGYRGRQRVGIVRCDTVITSNVSAELIKYASNTMLAMRISFANEVANVCEALDADVRDVTRGMGLDRRIGGAFLEAGAGWGGSCFGKDVSAFVDVAQKAGARAFLAKATIYVNQVAREHLVAKVLEHFHPRAPKKVAVWGIAFKPETDDIRDSPALYVIDALARCGVRVAAYDPMVPRDMESPLWRHFQDGIRKHGLPSGTISTVKTLEESLDGAEAVVVCTAGDEFRERQGLIAKAGVKLVVDGRNLLDWIELRAAGVTYVPVGRRPHVPRAAAATGT